MGLTIGLVQLISKLIMGLMIGRMQLVEQDVQEGIYLIFKHTPLRGPLVDGHCGGCVVVYPHQLGGGPSGGPGSSSRGRCSVPGSLA